MKQPIPPEVRSAWDSGHKLEAIKALREVTGMGLAEAKALLESDRSPQAVPGGMRGQELPAEVRAALDGGHKIEAIRLLRAATGIGLKEAKDRVDAAGAEAGAVPPSFDPGLSPGEVPRGGHRVVATIVLVLVVAVASWLYLRAG